jgi:hypothetical protein
MQYNGNYIRRHSDKIRKNLVNDSPHWLQEAARQKNPQLTLALADSILLVYDDLDRKLLAISSLN